MAPSDPPVTITLRIKVAPGHIVDGADEYTLGTSVPTSANIGQVRHRIQQTVPTNPSPERQRLLYGGRALVDNEQSLADALNTKRDPTQTEYVIHLLVKGDGMSGAALPQRRGLNTPERSASPAQTATENGAAQQQHQTAQTHHPEPNQPVLSQPQQTHVHHQVGPNVAPWLLHHGTHPMAGQMPLGNFSRNPGGHLPGAGIGLPHLGAHGQPPVVPGHGGMGAYEQQTVPQPGSTQQTQDADVGNPSAAGTDQQPAQPQPHQATRPLNGPGVHFEGIGPNGQRVTIHHSTLNMPAFGLPIAGSPFMPGVPIPGIGGQQLLNMHMPPPNPAARSGPSALDANRQNIAEAMNELDALHRSEGITEQQRQQLAGLRERVQRLGEYIDPFRLGPQQSARPGAPDASQAPSATQSAATQQFLNIVHPRLPFPVLDLPSMAAGHGGPNPPTNLSNTTCYLLSSPSGPRAILYSPHHGVFAGGNPTIPSHYPSSNNDRHPSPTPTTSPPLNPPGAEAGQPVPPAPGPDGVAQQQLPAAAAAAAAAQEDPMGPLGPIVAHFWLLLRVLIFTYFLLGSNMGWRRPLILLGVILGFWLLRAGLFGDGGVLRRWWDGIVQVPGAAEMNRGGAQAGELGNADRDGNAGVNEDGHVAGNGGENENGGANAGRAAARMPTPEELARRLLDREARERGERVNWLRERVRPAERAAALFVASLWPGVGEAHVRAREQEERRRAEEEVAARRHEEEQEEEEEGRRAAEEREKDTVTEADKEQEEVQVSREQEIVTAESSGEKSSGEKAEEVAG